MSKFTEYLEASGQFEVEITKDAQTIYNHLKKHLADPGSQEDALDEWLSIDWLTKFDGSNTLRLAPKQYNPTRLRNLKSRIRKLIRGR